MIEAGVHFGRQAVLEPKWHNTFSVRNKSTSSTWKKNPAMFQKRTEAVRRLVANKGHRAVVGTKRQAR